MEVEVDPQMMCLPCKHKPVLPPSLETERLELKVGVGRIWSVDFLGPQKRYIMCVIKLGGESTLNPFLCAADFLKSLQAASNHIST